MKKKEVWRSVRGYEGLYEVSNFGRVKSLNYRRSGKEGILKPSPDIWGYLKVGLCKNSKQETCQVHQLVMRAFVGDCPSGYEIDHFDWNPSNNRLDNLSYQPKVVNRARKSPEWHEKIKKRSQDPEYLRKHTEVVRKACCKPIDQYTLDGIFVKRWSSAVEIERELGIYNSNISKCCKGKYKSTGGFIWKFSKDSV